MKLKLITFDITGTLVALRESVGNQYAKVGLKYGVNAQPATLSKHFYTVFKQLLLEHPNFGESDIGWTEWWNRLVFLTFKDSVPGKCLENSPAISKISSDLIEVYKTKECWKLEDGAQHLLDTLQAKKVRLGVISNYDPRLEDILKDLDIYKYFNFVLTSYSAKCQKPDPAIFKAVEDKNKDLVKEEILHVGNNLKLDFLGAKSQGWHALLITKNLDEISDSFPKTEEGLVIKNVSDILQTLEHKKLL